MVMVVVVMMMMMMIFFQFQSVKFQRSLLGGSVDTTAWRVLRLQMEGIPSVMEGSCEYIE
jgi:hypothetical protein